jgi:predicted DNA-binding protein (MmcQ/YjbR family)
LEKTVPEHSGKKHWISIYIQSDVPDRSTEELIKHSVEEVIKTLPKKKLEAYRPEPFF